jgi:hypothetical protein
VEFAITKREKGRRKGRLKVSICTVTKSKHIKKIQWSLERNMVNQPTG